MKRTKNVTNGNTTRIKEIEAWQDEAMKIFGFTDKYSFRRAVKDRDSLGKDVVYTNHYCFLLK